MSFHLAMNRLPGLVNGGGFAFLSLPTSGENGETIAPGISARPHRPPMVPTSQFLWPM